MGSRLATPLGVILALFFSLTGCQGVEYRTFEDEAVVVWNVNAESLESSSPVALGGECEVYCSQLVTPSDLQQGGATVKPRVGKVPGSWSRQRNLDMDAHESATYRMRVAMPVSENDRQLALAMPIVPSSYALYVNGVRTSRYGTVGSESASMGAAGEQVIPFTLETRDADSDTLELLLQVSNYYDALGGLTISPMLGNQQAVSNWFHNGYSWQNLLFGLLVSISLLEVLLFYTLPRRRGFVWFALSLGLLLAHVLLSSRPLLLYWVAPFRWSAFRTLTDVVTLLLPAAMAMRIITRFPKPSLNGYTYAIAGLGGVFAITLVMLPGSMSGVASELTQAYFVLMVLQIATYLCYVLYKGGSLREAGMPLLAILAYSGFYLVELSASAGTMMGGLPLRYYGALIAVGGETLMGARRLVGSWRRMEGLMHRAKGERLQLIAKRRKLIGDAKAAHAYADNLITEGQRREWEIRGTEGMTASLAAKRNACDALCKTALRTMTSYLNANIGLLYIARLNPETWQFDLHLEASLGLTEEMREAVRMLKTGDSIVGEAFTNGELQYIRNLTSCPIGISSGLGESTPPALVIAPLATQSGLIGIMEIGRFREFEEFELSYIRRSAKLIAEEAQEARIRESLESRIVSLEAEVAAHRARAEEEARGEQTLFGNSDE